MNTEEIKKIITSQKEEIEEKFEKTKIIKREVEYKKLLSFLSAPNILAVLGLRRCGKSILSLQIFKEENFGYVNFDDERLSEFKTKDFEKLLNAFYELYGEIDKIILDEPQNIENWELFANRLRRTKKIIVTGSNSRMLSGELASVLTGRHIAFTLFPFSF
ncbi:MAG: AAA family ATPase, partial [Candidatus Diapherotrites archaeon]|nr:AAA family ATPase [Candidatus Diapherotrites archaeon]